MAFELTIDGYTFDNPPLDYRKRVALGNSPQPHYAKTATPFYRSDSQQITLELSGRLNLNDQGDLDELSKLQEKAIQGGEVEIQFDPFFSGRGVIEDDPFEQENQRGRYEFSIAINEEYTDDSAYPAHATPTTGNTFELGSFDFGFDPESVSQEYERQTERVDRLGGVAHTSDTEGLVTRVSLDGRVDGGGQAELWDKARSNALAYLTAEFQNGWALLNTLSVSKDDATPDYLQGLFAYSAEFLIVKDPSSGIGETSQFIDHEVGDSGTYTSDEDAGAGSDDGGLDFKVLGGTGSIDGRYVDWVTTTITLSDDTTNYVFVDDSDQDGVGDVTYNTTGFPSSDALPLYEVDTSNGDIVDVRDVRDSLLDSGDDTSSDFLFRDEFAIDDTAFEYARLVRKLRGLDIGDGSEIPNVETKTWSSTSDWDNAVSETRVSHSGDTVKLEPWKDGFEDGDLAEWDVNDLQTVQDRTYNGSWAAYSDNPLSGTYQARLQPPELDGGRQVSAFGYYWQDTTNSTGGGIRLLNSNGNVELGVATDNPEWDVDDASGINQVFGGNGYDRWVRFTIIFDWSAGTFDIDFEDLQTGDQVTGTYDLKDGVDIETIQIDEYASGNWQDGNGLDMWFDDISLFLDGSLTTATRTFSGESAPNLESVSYALGDGAIDLELIGSPGTDDEESVHIDMDGKSAFTTPWANRHTDFRMKLNFTTTSNNVPTFSAATLTNDEATGLIDWDGFSDFQSTFGTLTSVDFSAFGRSSFKEVLDVLDGGSASIGGGGGPTVSDEVIFWKKALDWDRAVSEQYAYHPSDVVNAGAVTDGFEDGSATDTWTLNGSVAASSSQSFNGSYSLEVPHSGGNAPVPCATWVPPGFGGGGKPDEISFYWRETSSSTGGGIRVMNSNGNEEFGFATDNPEWDISDGNQSSGSLREVFNPSSDTYGIWVYVRFYNLDWANGTFDIEIVDQSGTYSSYSESGIPMRNGVDFETIRVEGQNGEAWGDTNIEMWFDDVQVQAANSSLTTETKSFTEATQPDLVDLVYSLNGDAIDLDVIGSPGTASEEIQTVSLDGSSSFSIAWASDHTDFRVKIQFTGPNPTFSEINLEGPTGGSGGGQSVGWGSTFDWDYAASESQMVHPSDDLFIGLGYDDFDDYSTGSFPPSPWTKDDANSDGNVTNSRSYSGTNSWYYGTSSDSSDILVLAHSDDPSAQQYGEYRFSYWESTNSSGNGVRLLDSSGREITTIGTANPQFMVWDGNSNVQEIMTEGDLSQNYDTWRQIRIEIDWSAKTFDAYWTDLEDANPDFNSLDNAFWNADAEDIARVEIVRDNRTDDSGQSAHNWNGSSTDFYMDDVGGLQAQSGTLTTEFKYVSEPILPDQIKLENVLHSLNGGSIAIYVETDTNGDGTVDETSDPVNLDGTTEYFVSGLSSESDRFRLRFEFDGSGPDLDEVTLTGTAGSEDSDQNPNTTWTINGAIYDTSGNVYEGGGMKTNYGS